MSIHQTFFLWHTRTHTHACRPFTPSHTLLPSCYSQLVAIPRLSLKGTISLSVRFMLNLMSPCHTCLCGGSERCIQYSHIPPLLCYYLSHKPRSGRQVVMLMLHITSLLSLPSHLHRSTPWRIPVSVNCTIRYFCIFRFAATLLGNPVIEEIKRPIDTYSTLA